MEFNLIYANVEYHIVELEWIPNEIYEWCNQQFGDSGKRWFASVNKIYFISKLDHMMFLVRWS
jgi:hypothetical protein